MEIAQDRPVLASALIKKILNAALNCTGGSFKQLSKELKVGGVTIALWYRAGAHPGSKNLTKLEDFLISKFSAEHHSNRNPNVSDPSFLNWLDQKSYPPRLGFQSSSQQTHFNN